MAPATGSKHYGLAASRPVAAVGRTAPAAETRDADLSLDDFSGTGPSLDNKALQEYRKRIEDLEEHIEEAELDDYWYQSNNPVDREGWDSRWGELGVDDI